MFSLAPNPELFKERLLRPDNICLCNTRLFFFNRSELEFASVVF